MAKGSSTAEFKTPAEEKWLSPFQEDALVKRERGNTLLHPKTEKPRKGGSRTKRLIFSLSLSLSLSHVDSSRRGSTEERLSQHRVSSLSRWAVLSRLVYDTLSNPKGFKYSAGKRAEARAAAAPSSRLRSLKSRAAAATHARSRDFLSQVSRFPACDLPRSIQRALESALSTTLSIVTKPRDHSYTHSQTKPTGNSEKLKTLVLAAHS